MDYMKSGAKWYSAPKPMLLDSLFEVDLEKPTPRNDEPAFDAANVLRFGQDLIYLVSATGNELGGHWLQTILGDKFRVHFLKDVYYGSHIDSTLVALRPGLILCNPARVNDDTLPGILKQWKVIYSPPMENTDRFDSDYLSRCIGSDWIDMNAFSINPNLVVVDRNQTALIKTSGEARSRRDPAEAAALQDVGRRPPLRYPGRASSRTAPAILRLSMRLCPARPATGLGVPGRTTSATRGSTRHKHLRRSLDGDPCSDRVRVLPPADVGGVAAVPLGGGERATRAGGHLSVQPDGRLWRPPRERTASAGCPVAHRGVQPLGREVSGLSRPCRFPTPESP